MLSAFEIKLLPRCKEFGISLYARFKDDILVIFSCAHLLNLFFGHMKQRHPFTLTCEAVNSTEIQFLDVLISKTPCGLQVRPWTKESKLNTPLLSRHSAHNPAIHRSWPCSLLKSRMSLCSSRRIKLEDAQQLIDRAETQKISARAIQSMKETFAQLRGTDTHSPKHGVSVGRDKTNRVCHLILPFYHSVYRAGIIPRLNAYLQSSFVQRQMFFLFPDSREIRVGWRNVVPNLIEIAKSCGGDHGAVGGKHNHDGNLIEHV